MINKHIRSLLLLRICRFSNRWTIFLNSKVGRNCQGCLLWLHRQKNCRRKCWDPKLWKWDLKYLVSDFQTSEWELWILKISKQLTHPRLNQLWSSYTFCWLLSGWSCLQAGIASLYDNHFEPAFWYPYYLQPGSMRRTEPSDLSTRPLSTRVNRFEYLQSKSWQEVQLWNYLIEWYWSRQILGQAWSPYRDCTCRWFEVGKSNSHRHLPLQEATLSHRSSTS